MKSSKRRSHGPQRFVVTKDGEGIASHAGSAALRELSDKLGLTSALSEGLATMRERRSAHDPGRVLRDLAVMLVDGGDCVSDIDALRDQPDLFGKVASTATAWRVVNGMTETNLSAVREARRRAREQAWKLTGAPQEVVLDFDATLVTAHSEKENAAPTFKRGFGFHPLFCYLDGRDEALAGRLRRGNAGSGTAVDHIEVLEEALMHLPKQAWRKPVLVRGDSSALSHEFVNKLRAYGIRFSIGFDLTEEVRDAVLSIRKRAWRPLLDEDGDALEDAAVCELTNLDLSHWPAGTRAICRREKPHPGAQLTFTDVDGYRFQVFVTDQSDQDIHALEARHREHARVENRIRCAKDTGLRGEAQHWEPGTLRYRLFHTAARIARSGRRWFLRRPALMALDADALRRLCPAGQARRHGLSTDSPTGTVSLRSEHVQIPAPLSQSGRPRPVDKPPTPYQPSSTQPEIRVRGFKMASDVITPRLL